MFFLFLTFIITLENVSCQNNSVYSKEFGKVRIQILSPNIVRAEVKGPKGFEDRATYNIPSRKFPGVSFSETVGPTTTEIKTPNFIVSIPNTADNIKNLKVIDNAKNIIYNYTKLPHTTRFMESPVRQVKTKSAYIMADNPRVVPAPWGYSPMPSTNTQHTNYNGWDCTNQPRPANSDVYMIFPMGDIYQLRRDFVLLYGPAEFIPLKALGLWYSYYFNFTQQECLNNIDLFHTHGFPLDYYVVDTDWRMGASSGYEINETLFPDMRQFFIDAHAKHVKVVLNDHPEAKRRKHALTQMDLLYRNHNLRTMLDMGLDYWWFDRNWNTSIIIPFPEIPKESFGSYLYYDIIKSHRPKSRPFILSNFDGIRNGKFLRPPTIASHRFTCQWTGDTRADKDLGQEIVNAVRMGVLTGFPYLSSDISGHLRPLSDRLYARWSQYAAFSPIYRLHGTQGMNRMPWLYRTAENIARNYVQMRYRLLPLFYALAHLTLHTGLPIARRVDLSYPEYAKAADNTQFTLGTGIREGGILVAPMKTAKGVSRHTRDTRSVFVPDGKWIDVWYGRRVVGPATITVKHSVRTSPLFVREGTILPLVPNVNYIGERGWDEVTLDVYPSPTLTGTSLLYEDDGESIAYQTGAFRKTQLATTSIPDTASQVVTISAATGMLNFGGVFSSFTNRTWKIRVHAPPEWRRLTRTTLNGVVYPHVRFIPQALPSDRTVSPFAIEGPSLDSNIYEMVFTAPLSQASTIEFAWTIS